MIRSPVSRQVFPEVCIAKTEEPLSDIFVLGTKFEKYRALGKKNQEHENELRSHAFGHKCVFALGLILDFLNELLN